MGFREGRLEESSNGKEEIPGGGKRLGRDKIGHGCGWRMTCDFTQSMPVALRGMVGKALQGIAGHRPPSCMLLFLLEEFPQ